jgi:hypothetical protein
VQHQCGDDDNRAEKMYVYYQKQLKEYVQKDLNVTLKDQQL